MQTLDMQSKLDESPLQHDFETRRVRGDGFTAELTIDVYNARIKVQRHEGPDLKGLIHTVLTLARERDLSKISFLSRDDEWETFLSRGYTMEGILKGYYRGSHGYIMSRFLDPGRRYSGRLDEENEIIEQIWEADTQQQEATLRPGYELRDGRPDEAGAIAEMYGRIFDYYPTPIHREHYIVESMKEGMIYKVIWDGETPVSAAGAYLDQSNFAGELTDCGTLPEYRGNGFISVLIQALEEELQRRQYGALYGLARSVSFGMNVVFKRFGYQYRGRLINHSRIGDEGFEDLNVWVKQLLG